ncbi:MAG: hypothetical protein HQL13_08330 [Candidatus Omnitrophica bacterium]|nr:hypothetical protein [Candidatus Omnitrophota bacterium]
MLLISQFIFWLSCACFIAAIWQVLLFAVYKTTLLDFVVRTDVRNAGLTALKVYPHVDRNRAKVSNGKILAYGCVQMRQTYVMTFKVLMSWMSWAQAAFF